MFAEINQGTLDAGVRNLVNAAGVIYLFAEDDLYRLDPLTRVPMYLGNFDTARELTAVGDRVYFTANNSSVSNRLFVVAGTTVSPVTIKDGAFIRSPEASSLIAMGNELFFRGRLSLSSGGEELWKTDGTMAGTMLVADINSGTGGSSPSMGAVIDGILYFDADDGIHGREWWKSDGTIAGTQLLADINPGTASGVPSNSKIIGVGSQIFFRANDGTHGDELWSIDQATGVPHLVKDIVPGTGGSSPAWFAPLGDELIFAAYGGPTGREVWRSDGTASGTVKLSNIHPGSPSAGPVTLTPSGPFVYFGVDSSSAGTQLWKTDGTSTGTMLVKQIGTGTGNGLVAAADHDGVLYFSGTDVDGNEPWRSDGTPNGTYQVADLCRALRTQALKVSSR